MTGAAAVVDVVTGPRFGPVGTAVGSLVGSAVGSLVGSAVTRAAAVVDVVTEAADGSPQSFKLPGLSKLHSRPGSQPPPYML